MLSKEFFERPSMEVAIDLGLRKLRFSKKGALYVPEETKEAIITRTVAYGKERGYEPQKTREGQLKKSVQSGYQEPGLMDIYFTRFGYTLAISTGREGEFSEISIHAGFPISGFDNEGKNLDKLLDGPLKLTKNLGIDKSVRGMLHGKPVYDHSMIKISDEKLPGTYTFDTKQISKDAIGSFSFRRE